MEPWPCTDDGGTLNISKKGLTTLEVSLQSTVLCCLLSPFHGDVPFTVSFSSISFQWGRLLSWTCCLRFSWFCSIVFSENSDKIGIFRSWMWCGACINWLDFITLILIFISVEIVYNWLLSIKRVLLKIMCWKGQNWCNIFSFSPHSALNGQ